jgi:hypothetical protein
MAEQIKAGLSSDPSKVNPTGASQEDLSEYQKSLEEQIKSLEQRYANPNWFKVAAGFLKPQLGGFAASLGSASEALGENVEQGRAAALPIAQMRSQLAQSKILTGQKKTQSDEFEAWRSSGKPMDQATFSRIFSLDPSSQVAEAAKAAYEGQRKDLEFTNTQQRLMMDAIQMKQAKGMPLSQTEQSFLSGLPGQLSLRQEAKPILPGGQPVGAEGPASVRTPSDRAQGDINALNQELKRLPAGDPRRQILDQEMRDAQQRAGGAPEAMQAPAAAPAASQASEEWKPYTPTFAHPNLSGLSDQERESVVAQHRENMRTAEGRAEAQVNQYRPLATGTNYTTLDNQYSSAINLLESQPKVAAKVFNLLRRDGSLMNQVASAAQSGFGVNFGNMAANLNLPVNAFMAAGLTPAEQMLADKMVKAMLVVGNAKLASQGITPEKGKEAYDQILSGTKASLSQRPVTALHNLKTDYANFKQSKAYYDQIQEEFPKQQRHSSTPYADILQHSPKLKKIAEDTDKELKRYDREYEQAIEHAKKKREERSQ